MDHELIVRAMGAMEKKSLSRNQSIMTKGATRRRLAELQIHGAPSRFRAPVASRP